ncbi:hypothetical protein GCM10027265_40140 [Jatrophihabitans fulvus]
MQRPAIPCSGVVLPVPEVGRVAPVPGEAVRFLAGPVIGESRVGFRPDRQDPVDCTVGTGSGPDTSGHKE